MYALFFSSYLGSDFLCSEWSTRGKKKHKRKVLVFMSNIWISKCPVTRMMGTHSFFHIFFSTDSIICSHIFFPLIHERVLTPFFRALKHFCTFLLSLTHEWVSASSHMWISECCSCHTIQLEVTRRNEWRSVVISRIWGASASLRCEWVMSHMWMSECHVTYMNEWALLMSLNSCHTYEWKSVCLLSHVWVRGCFSSLRMSHVTCMNKEAPENVFQARTSETMRNDPHVTLCWHRVYCNVL